VDKKGKNLSKDEQKPKIKKLSDPAPFRHSLAAALIDQLQILERSMREGEKINALENNFKRSYLRSLEY
jgi:hypothetical protein